MDFGPFDKITGINLFLKPLSVDKMVILAVMLDVPLFPRGKGHGKPNILSLFKKALVYGCFTAAGRRR
jgi:hypothetical protein